MKLVLINNTRGFISGGYQTYLDNLIPRLANNKEISSMVTFVPKKIINNFEKSNKYRPIINNKKLKEEIQIINPDLIFCPTIQYTYKWTVPFIVMVRNMEPLVQNDKNNPLLEKIKNSFRKKLTKNACKNADGIIAVSDYVQSYLINNFDIKNTKIKRIYHGIDKVTLKNEHIISENQIFTAGSIRPARGLEDIIMAFSLIKNKNPSLKLVIGGDVDPIMLDYKRKLNQLINSKGLDRNITFLGKLNKDEMIKYFKTSKLFIMTSRAEACPNIAIEALKYGNFIISTDTEPMPEFFLSAANYYKERDHTILAKRIEETILLSNSKLTNYRVIYDGILEKFNWDICAMETISFFKEIVKINK